MGGSWSITDEHLLHTEVTHGQHFERHGEAVAD